MTPDPVFTFTVVHNLRTGKAEVTAQCPFCREKLKRSTPADFAVDALQEFTNEELGNSHQQGLCARPPK